MEMTKEALRQVCKQHKDLYLTPGLNDKLYCNFKGFGSVANLEEYVNLKALFLEGNAIDSLRGLPPLPALKCLYVQQNLLTSLEGLGGLEALDTLNASGNQLSSLGGLERLPGLHTLMCADNQLSAADAVQALTSCTALESVDLQNNKLADPAALLAVLRMLPQLKCLYLAGNPAVSALPSYRKTVISSIPTLSYLDDRPVFELERRCAEAWARGGLEAERQERALCEQERQGRERRNFEALKRVREEGFRKRREVLGLAPGNTDPFLDTVDDAEWEFPEEPPELKAARERLAAGAVGANQGASSQADEPLPELRDGGSVGCASAVYELPGREEEDARAVLEERAAHLEEVKCDEPTAQPEENSNPNTAPAAPAPGPPAEEADVPMARVTVAVGDSCCGVGGQGASVCGGPGQEGLLGGRESNTNDKPEFDESATRGPQIAAMLSAVTAERGQATVGGDGDAASNSVASEEAADLDELD